MRQLQILIGRSYYRPWQSGWPATCHFVFKVDIGHCASCWRHFATWGLLTSDFSVSSLLWCRMTGSASSSLCAQVITGLTIHVRIHRSQDSSVCLWSPDSLKDACCLCQPVFVHCCIERLSLSSLFIKDKQNCPSLHVGFKLTQLPFVALG